MLALCGLGLFFVFVGAMVQSTLPWSPEADGAAARLLVVSGVIFASFLDLRLCSKAWVCESGSKAISQTSLEGFGTNPGHGNPREQPRLRTLSRPNDDPWAKRARRTQESAAGLLRTPWLFLGLLASYGAKHSPPESRSHRRRFAIIYGLRRHFCVLFGSAVLF